MPNYKKYLSDYQKKPTTTNDSDHAKKYLKIEENQFPEITLIEPVQGEIQEFH